MSDDDLEEYDDDEDPAVSALVGVYKSAQEAMKSELDRLRAELERERMRLAACGVVAQANTPETAAEARKMHEDYRSASCDAVAAAVDREMSLREALYKITLLPTSWQTISAGAKDIARAALQGAKND